MNLCDGLTKNNYFVRVLCSGTEHLGCRKHWHALGLKPRVYFRFKIIIAFFSLL